MWREHTAAGGEEGQAALKRAKAQSQGGYDRAFTATVGRETMEGSYVPMKPLYLHYSWLEPDKAFS